MLEADHEVFDIKFSALRGRACEREFGVDISPIFDCLFSGV